MTGFDLPENFIKNPEKVLKKSRLNVSSSQKSKPADQPVITAPPRSKPMAEKALKDYSAPSANNVLTGSEIDIGDGNFEIKTSLITMVQASPFCGKANEDANAHLQQFLEI
ncbi:hypothetical protein QOZ80_4AG0324390 [Eleusine coracana subsp. coracana]|nr:hypothetical protein QOZ80_4AG0324390 [Eleusine coracana subsp. coracana]